MDLVDQLTTVNLKGKSNIINFIEFFVQKPQSIIPNFLGNNSWQTVNYGEVTIKTIIKENVVINYCMVPCEPYLEDNHDFFEILYHSAANVVLVPGLASLIHNSFWHYVIGNEKLNPKIPIFILSENPTSMSIDECKRETIQLLNLEIVWLREYEVYCLVEDPTKKISWDRFVSRLLKKTIDFLIVTNTK
ncbi:MAG: hypothetical protein ACW981_00230 [Candidatus Hodarchaeales archaeon]|jgi:hypothetical protein